MENKTNWTPGPWKVWIDQAVNILDSEGNIIAEMNWSRRIPAIDPKRLKPNANLIASAPDMYEALNSTYDYLCNLTKYNRNKYYVKEYDAINALTATVKAALLKANGTITK